MVYNPVAKQLSDAKYRKRVVKAKRGKGSYSRKAAAVAIALGLSACATTPGIQIRTVEVPVIELRHCLTEIIETPADLARPLPTDARDLSAVLAAQLLRWRQYGRETTAAMQRCAG